MAYNKRPRGAYFILRVLYIARRVHITTSVSESSLRIIVLSSLVLPYFGGQVEGGGGGASLKQGAFIKEEAFEREGKGDFALSFLVTVKSI